MYELKRLEWDSTFWNVDFYDVVSLEHIDEHRLIQPFILQRKVDISNFEEIQILESFGFQSVERKLTFRKDVAKDVKGLNSHIHAVTIENIERLDEEIGSIFVENSRYRFLDHQIVKHFYYLWVKNSCLGKMDSYIDGYFIENELAGFISYRVIQNTLVIGLFGVLEKHQGKGIASVLLKYIEYVANGLRLEQIQISTQASNQHAVNVYKKNGYSIINEELWYYKMKFNKGEQK